MMFEKDYLVIVLHLALILISMLRYRHVLSIKEAQIVEDAVVLYFMLTVLFAFIFYSSSCCTHLIFTYAILTPLAIIVFLVSTIVLTPFFDKHKQVKRKQLFTLIFTTVLGLIGSVAIALYILGGIATIGG